MPIFLPIPRRIHNNNEPPNSSGNVKRKLLLIPVQSNPMSKPRYVPISEEELNQTEEEDRTKNSKISDKQTNKKNRKNEIEEEQEEEPSVISDIFDKIKKTIENFL